MSVAECVYLKCLSPHVTVGRHLSKSDSSNLRMPAAQHNTRGHLSQQLTSCFTSNVITVNCSLAGIVYNNICLFSASHLAILPDLRVCLSAILDLLHQSPQGFQGAWVDEWQPLFLYKSFICTQTQTPEATKKLNHIMI